MDLRRVAATGDHGVAESRLELGRRSRDHETGEDLGQALARPGDALFRDVEIAERAEVEAALPLVVGERPELRAAVHEATGRDDDRWYYRATGTGGREHKPRFLDLANPLSVAGLRRDLARSGRDDLLFLEAMAPTPENASPAGSPPRVHELMIETRGASS